MSPAPDTNVSATAVSKYPEFARGTNTAVVRPRYSANTKISMIVVDTGPEITAEFQLYLFPSNGSAAPIKLPNTIETRNETAAIEAITNIIICSCPFRPFSCPNRAHTRYVLAYEPIATAVPIHNPALTSFINTFLVSFLPISPIANASMITADDCDPVLPAESLIDDATDNAVANAVEITIEPTAAPAALPAVQ